MNTEAGNVTTCAVSKQAVVNASNYFNKASGEAIERECKIKLQEGCDELVLNFSETELVNSVGVSILLGIIDSAKTLGTKVVFADVKQDTIDLFDMLGVSRHVTINI